MTARTKRNAARPDRLPAAVLRTTFAVRTLTLIIFWEILSGRIAYNE